MVRLWWTVGFVAVVGIFALGYRGIELYVPEDWIVARGAFKAACFAAFASTGVYLRLWSEWAAAQRSDDPQRRAGAVRPELHLRRQYWRYALLASVLPMFAVSVVVVHRLVPADWGWFWPQVMDLALCVLALGAAVLALKRIGPLPRPAAPAAQTAPAMPTRSSGGPHPVPSPRFGATLVWHGGSRQCAVYTSARLRDQLLHLHLSSAEIPRIVDFVPAVGAQVSVALGGEDSLVTIMPVGGDPLVVTKEPDGLAVTPVRRAEDGTVVFPPESAIAVEVAIDVLDRYFTTGELPGRSATRPSGEPLGPTTTGSLS
ncbi:hypothetical protein [Catellatospora sichuanensis]|uniref:hypothetical protein n=1 Tax=Catellatospora sichuanensis TaxID=1969805 RepID=UPI0011821365|nr:hypothetical protein [Catellatospora sichuanensis]